MPKKEANRMVLISVHVPKRILDAVDRLVKEGIVPNRSEAIRMAILMLLERHIFVQGPSVLPKSDTTALKSNYDPEEEAFRALVLKGR